MIERIEFLTKFSKNQSELIKQLEEKIDNLIKTNKSIEHSSASLSQLIIAL